MSSMHHLQAYISSGDDISVPSLQGIEGITSVNCRFPDEGGMSKVGGYG